MTARKRTHYSTSEIATISQMAGEGRSDREIALSLGRPDQCVIGRIRRREGIPSGQMRRYSPDEEAVIRAGVDAGKSSRQIAEETGRTAAAIETRLATLGLAVPCRPRRETRSTTATVRIGRSEAAIDTLRATPSLAVPRREARSCIGRVRWTGPDRYTDGEIAAIRAMAGEKRTDEEIGLLLGRGKSGINAIRRRLGIAAGGGTYDPAPKVEPELVERIRSLAGKGWSDERIGRGVGRSRLQIARLRKRLGIGPGNPRPNSSSATVSAIAEARRDAHIQLLRERREARRAAEREGVEA